MKDDLEGIYQRVDNMNAKELDALPHGAIQLDAKGNILQFNLYESQLSKVKKESAVGKNFFKDVAPCTDVQEFYGRFKQGVTKKQLHEKFRYHFAFKQDPRNVLITLFYSQQSQSVWVFVQPTDAGK